MTLEQRLSETLHEVDSFEPSPDLYARVSRSLDEDRARRRRATLVWLASLASAAIVMVCLGLLVFRDRGGFLVVPRWGVELLETVVLVTIVLLLAPLIRRFGGFYVSEVFRLDPPVGDRFLRLLDIAYYLVFSGRILSDADLTGLGGAVRLGVELEAALDRIAWVLTMMGALHAGTLLALPVVGLVFSSVVRRARRLQAGALAPDVSPQALQADRLASWIVWALAALVVVGALLTIGVVIGVGLDR
ncbi:MAG: hypothetical protein ACRDWS_14995 [Acidimicrobiia bacterium]